MTAKTKIQETMKLFVNYCSYCKSPVMRRRIVIHAACDDCKEKIYKRHQKQYHRKQYLLNKEKNQQKSRSRYSQLINDENFKQAERCRRKEKYWRRRKEKYLKLCKKRSTHD